jgi:hypothetical protein
MLIIFFQNFLIKVESIFKLLINSSFNILLSKNNLKIRAKFRDQFQIKNKIEICYIYIIKFMKESSIEEESQNKEEHGKKNKNYLNKNSHQGYN